MAPPPSLGEKGKKMGGESMKQFHGLVLTLLIYLDRHDYPLRPLSPPPGVPKAPRNLTVEDVGRYSLTLAWEPPASDGGGEISGYVVETCDAFSTRWVPVNRAPVGATSYTLRDLTEDAEYTFRWV